MTSTKKRTNIRPYLSQKRSRKLPGQKITEDTMLSRLYIASPCDVSWDSMTGDARVRSCADCKKNVYNISDMSKTEAEAFLIKNGTSICATFYKRADGTILTDDCPVGLRKIRDAWKSVRRVAALVIGSALSLSALSARADGPKISPPMPGGISFMPSHYLACTIDKITVGKHALKTPGEVFLKDGQIYIKEGKDAKSAEIPLSNIRSVQEAKSRADLMVREEKLITAEIYYKVALKLEEVQPVRQPALMKNLENGYANLLRKMHREQEAEKVEKGD